MVPCLQMSCLLAREQTPSLYKSCRPNVLLQGASDWTYPKHSSRTYSLKMTALFRREIPVCSAHLQMTRCVNFRLVLNFFFQLSLPTAGHSWANVDCALIWRQSMAKWTGLSQESKLRNIDKTFIWWWAHTVKIRGGKMAFLLMSKSTTSTSHCGECGKFKKEKTGSSKRNLIKQLVYFLPSFQGHHLPGVSDLQFDNKMGILLNTAVVNLAFTLSGSYSKHFFSHTSSSQG